MPLRVTFSPEADDRLEALQTYLADRFYPSRSEAYVRRLAMRCLSIGSAPLQGQRRDDIRPGVRTTGFERNVTILFEVRETEVIILDIYYGGRQVPFLVP